MRMHLGGYIFYTLIAAHCVCAFRLYFYKKNYKAKHGDLCNPSNPNLTISHLKCSSSELAKVEMKM